MIPATMYVKRFIAWLGIKQKLDTHDYQPPLVSEGDLWWCAVGENVGIEVSGKGEHFTRPVIVIKKFGRFAFFGIPTTTHTREGTWYVQFTHTNIVETALLSQARAFSYKRLHRKMGSLSETDFQTVKEALVRLLS